MMLAMNPGMKSRMSTRCPRTKHQDQNGPTGLAPGAPALLLKLGGPVASSSRAELGFLSIAVATSRLAISATWACAASVANVDVRLDLVAAALVDDFPAHDAAGVGEAVAGRGELALDAVDAFAEHDLDAGGALAEDHDFEELAGFGADLIFSVFIGVASRESGGWTGQACFWTLVRRRTAVAANMTAMPSIPLRTHARWSASTEMKWSRAFASEMAQPAACRSA